MVTILDISTFGGTALDTMTATHIDTGAPEPVLFRTGRIGRRWFAFAIDSTILGWALSIGTTIASGAYLVAASTVSNCTISRDGSCDPSIWLDRLLLFVLAVWAIFAAYICNVRPVRNGTGSFGMRQVGLTVVAENPDMVLSSGQSSARTWISQPVLWTFIGSLAALAINDTDVSGILYYAVSITAFVSLIASAVLVLLPGHRSLADAATRTRVIHVRAMSYVAAVAAVVVPPTALVVLTSALVGISQRPDPIDAGVRFGGRNYDDFTWVNDTENWLLDLAEWFTDGTARWVLLGALWLATAALTWWALRETRWETDRKAGRGLAIYATLFTLLPVAAMIVGGLWALGSALVERLS